MIIPVQARKKKARQAPAYTAEPWHENITPAPEFNFYDALAAIPVPQEQQLAELDRSIRGTKQAHQQILNMPPPAPVPAVSSSVVPTYDDWKARSTGERYSGVPISELSPGEMAEHVAELDRAKAEGRMRQARDINRAVLEKAPNYYSGYFEMPREMGRDEESRNQAIMGLREAGAKRIADIGADFARQRQEKERQWLAEQALEVPDYRSALAAQDILVPEWERPMSETDMAIAQAKGAEAPRYIRGDQMEALDSEIEVLDNQLYGLEEQLSAAQDRFRTKDTITENEMLNVERMKMKIRRAKEAISERENMRRQAVGLEFRKTGEQAKGPTAVNPQTGERVFWNGEQWLPVQ